VIGNDSRELSLVIMIRVSWSMDPKQKPKTKEHGTPTPPKRKKGS